MKKLLFSGCFLKTSPQEVKTHVGCSGHLLFRLPHIFEHPFPIVLVVFPHYKFHILKEGRFPGHFLAVGFQTCGFDYTRQLHLCASQSLGLELDYLWRRQGLRRPLDRCRAGWGRSAGCEDSEWWQRQRKDLELVTAASWLGQKQWLPR